MKKKIITSAIAFTAFAAIGIGTTFALFTGGANNNIAITAGKVEVTAELGDLALYSPTAINYDGTIEDDANAASATHFANGGTAIIDGNNIILENMTPGDKVLFTLTSENHSNVTIKYRTSMVALDDTGLAEGLIVKFDDAVTQVNALMKYTHWVTATPADDFLNPLAIEIELPTTAGNTYQDKEARIEFALEAVQGNVVTENVDAAIYDVASLKAFRDEVNAGDDYDNKLVILTADIDLDDEVWTPIGTTATPFKGHFKGYNHTIANFELGGVVEDNGLFGYADDFVIQDLKIEEANITATGGISAAFLLGHTEAGGFVKGVTIDDTNHAFSASKYLAGVVSYAPKGNLHFENTFNASYLETAGGAGSYRVGGFVTQIGTTNGRSTFVNVVNEGKVIANGTSGVNGWAGGFIAQKINGSGVSSILNGAQISFKNASVVTTDGVENYIQGARAGAFIGNRTYDYVEVTDSYLDGNLITTPNGLIGYDEGVGAYVIDGDIYLARNTVATDMIDGEVSLGRYLRPGHGFTLDAGKFILANDAIYEDDDIKFTAGAILSVNFKVASGFKVQRGLAVYGVDYEMGGRYIYRFDIQRVYEEDAPATNVWADDILGTVTSYDNFVLETGSYAADPTPYVDLDVYEVTYTGSFYRVDPK